MSIRKKMIDSDGTYFITFTCKNWLPLFEIIDGYDRVYQWFDYLKAKGHFILGYVIMPNHVHSIIHFRNSKKPIELVVGDAKRLMAYAIIKWLRDNQKEDILRQLACQSDKTKYQVFEPSFDRKSCESDYFFWQKLNYIHENPCRRKIPLVERPEDYKHSSAAFYLGIESSRYPVTHYMTLSDLLEQDC
ncbi:transposase [Hydrotalea flava]|uniref:transposase n=1 Tax=Hydrotalea flava TaxID=714549 RepID=UPI000837A246|nr:transposase [Hydrotalea flava]